MYPFQTDAVILIIVNFMIRSQLHDGVGDASIHLSSPTANEDARTPALAPVAASIRHRTFAHSPIDDP